MPNLERYLATTAYIRQSADAAGLTVRYSDDPGCVASCSMATRTITLPAPKVEWDDRRWGQFEFDVEHEIGHACAGWDQSAEVFAKTGMKGTEAFITNILADHGQERARYGKFLGVDRVLKQGRADALETVPVRNLEHPEGACIEACLVWDHLCRIPDNPLLAPRVEAMVADLTGKSKENLEALCASGLDPRTLASEWEAHDMALKVMELCGLAPPEGGGEGEDTSESEDASEGEGEGESEGEEGGESGDESEGESEGGGKDTTTSPGDEDKDPGTEDYKEQLVKVLKYDHETKVQEGGDHESDLHTEYEPSGDYSTALAFREVLEISFAGVTPVGSDRPLYARREFPPVTSTPAFAQRVRKLIQVLTLARRQVNQRRGKLRCAALHKVAQADNRVYQQTSKRLDLDVCVSIGVDFSGSMSGDKIHHAVHAVQLAYAAVGVLGVPVEVWGFTDWEFPVEFRLKKFEERPTPEVFAKRCSFAASSMRNNDDALSILHAWKRVVQRKEKRKLMIVLSDGCPAGSGPHHDWDAMRLTMDTLLADRKVEFYGIGIMDESVEAFYPKHRVIRSGDEIETALLEVLKKEVVSGH